MEQKTKENAVEKKSGILRASRNLALSTFVCRILGFLREILMASVFGTGIMMSAWVEAITLPNLFRRILGEGALGTALIPMIVHSIGEEGKERARARFSTVFLHLTVLLCVISLMISIPAWILGRTLPDGLWKLAAQLTPILMPYCVFICAVGVLTSYANSLRVYFLPSLAAILQNAVVIGALLLVVSGLCGRQGMRPLEMLAGSVILSGILELMLMFWIIRREKMSLLLNRKVWRDSETLRMIFKLALPGIFAAAALQTSLVVDRLVAGWIGSYAPASLYYSERLVYLPIGVFAFAFGTVSASEMSHAAAAREFSGMIRMMMFSLRNLLFITIPIAVFMFLFSEDMIRLFFMRGRFDTESLRETAYAMHFYTLGIPFFAAYKVVVSGFTARKEMLTPLKISLITVSLNIGMNLALMIPLRQGGIALATVISSVTGNLLLMTLLIRQFGMESFDFRRFFLLLLQTGTAAAAAGAAAVFLPPLILRGAVRIPLFHLTAGGVIFAVLFLLAGRLMRMEEASLFLSRFLKLKKR